MARSKLEDALDVAIASLYPHDPIQSDMPIKIRGRTLYVDRVIKSAKIAIETDGRQHSEFVAHFHGDADGFKSHKERDAIKAAWLEANGYTLIRFKHTDKITAETLREAILEAYDGERRPTDESE
jgi:very-short-patch-repair endonuclease